MKKAIDGLQKAQTFIGSVCLAIFLLTVVAQMLTRYMGISAMWTEDVSMYSFIWSIFMGASVMVRDDKHFAFTAFSDKIKGEKAKAVVGIIIHILMMVFNILIAFYGWKLMIKFWNYKWVAVPSFKRGPTWMCLPLAGITGVIYLLEALVNDFKKLKGGAN